MSTSEDLLKLISALNNIDGLEKVRFKHLDGLKSWSVVEDIFLSLFDLAESLLPKKTNDIDELSLKVLLDERETTRANEINLSIKEKAETEDMFRVVFSNIIWQQAQELGFPLTKRYRDELTLLDEKNVTIKIMEYMVKLLKRTSKFPKKKNYYYKNI